MRTLAATVAVALQPRDEAAAKSLTAGMGALDDVVRDSVLARSNMTDVTGLFPLGLCVIRRSDDADVARAPWQRRRGRRGQGRRILQPGRRPHADGRGLRGRASELEGFEKARKTLSDFSDRLDEVTAILNEAGQSTRTLARAAERERSKLLGLVGQQGTTMERLDKVRGQLGDILNQARNAAERLKADSQVQTAERFARISWWANALALGAIISIGLGLALAAFLQRFTKQAIIAPLSQLELVMTRLARGDTDAEPRGVRRSDAIGAMARSVAVFRDNAVERLRLEDAARRAVCPRAAPARGRSPDRTIPRRRRERAPPGGEHQPHGDDRARPVGDRRGSVVPGDGRRRRHRRGIRHCQHGRDRGRRARALDPRDRPADRQRPVDHRGHQQCHPGGGRGGHEARRGGAEDRPRGRPDPRDRRADQPACPQRDASRRRAPATRLRLRGGRREVKALASQTGKATDQIAQQIGEIQVSTKDAVDAIGKITSAMGDIGHVTTAIAAAVEQQGAATAEISRNVGLAAKGTEELSSTVATVTSAIGATSTQSTSVLTASDAVATAARRLSLSVDDFLRGVEAA